ncbi:MAG: response regulator [Candidatus Omnitrophica bacterium]|nr:response regulator [Candidatus Omnitrophota bacterium]
MTAKKVLIVDNDQDFLGELRETLELSGYEMIAVEDSTMALETAERVQPDIALLDLKMPGKNGFELAYDINRSTRLRNTTIFAMTGFYQEGYDPLFEVCGIKKCFKKPFYPLNVIAEFEGVH